MMPCQAYTLAHRPGYRILVVLAIVSTLSLASVRAGATPLVAGPPNGPNGPAQLLRGDPIAGTPEFHHSGPGAYGLPTVQALPESIANFLDQDDAVAGLDDFGVPPGTTARESPAGFGDGGFALAAPAGRDQMFTVRELLRSLVNESADGGAPSLGSRPRYRTRRRPNQGGRDAARRRHDEDPSGIDSTVDPALIELLSSIVRPTVQPSGLVTFSLAGFGDFAIVLSQDTRILQVVDLNRGSRLQMSGGRGANAPGAMNYGWPGDGPADKPKHNQAHGNFFLRVVYYVLVTLRHPLVIVGLLLLLVFSILWQINRRLRHISRRRSRRIIRPNRTI